MRKLALVALACAACGASGGDARISGALSAVTATSHLRTLWSSMQSNATTAQQALGEFGNITGFLRMLQAPARPPAGLTVGSAAAFPGCVSLTASATGATATFDSCTAGGVTLSGQLTKDGDTYSANLQLNFSVSGYTGTVTYAGAITVTPALLHTPSPLTLTVSLNAQGQSYALNIGATFNNVTLCAGGGPNSGSLSVYGQGNAGGTNVDASATVTFGPGCGTGRAT
jgi:hypothetical protein